MRNRDGKWVRSSITVNDYMNAQQRNTDERREDIHIDGIGYENISYKGSISGDYNPNQQILSKHNTVGAMDQFGFDPLNNNEDA